MGEIIPWQAYHRNVYSRCMWPHPVPRGHSWRPFEPGHQAELLLGAERLNPKNPVSIFAACKVYSKKRFYTIAIEHCEKALVLNPNGLNLMNRLAWLYAKKSIKLELALELINKSIKVSPDRADFIDTLSEVLFVQGKVIMAEKAISKAIKLKPNNAYYKQQLRRFKNSRLIEAIGN